MKIFFASLCFLFSVSALATKGYNLKMELSVNGKKVAEPHISVHEGKKASITQNIAQEATSIEVTAVEGKIQQHEGILMNFTVSRIGPDGKKTIISKPQILAKEGDLSQIIVGSSNGKDEMSLSIVAERTSF